MNPVRKRTLILLGGIAAGAGLGLLIGQLGAGLGFGAAVGLIVGQWTCGV